MSDWVTVSGDSMRPVLRPGDRVAVEWDAPARPDAGTLVLARSFSSAGEGDAFIVHRVLGAGGRTDGGTVIRTKGDFAFVAESHLPERVWGRITRARFAGSDREVDLSPGAIDRLIAAFSARAAGSDGLIARVARKFTYALGALRREIL